MPYSLRTFMARRLFVATSFALFCVSASVSAQSKSLTITLTGQSMIRSDIRATSPDAVPRIKALLSGDVIFTNLEGVIAEPTQGKADERPGFLIPPSALDTLTAVGINLLSLANNHAFDMQTTGIVDTLREVKQRNIAYAGTGRTVDEAASPGYLKTENGTVALIASASGLIATGGKATGDQPGVNELRIFAGDKQNEATADMPGAPTNHPDEEDARRILQSIRETKRHADLVVVYQHNHVFSSHSFANVFYEGLAERLAPNEWLQRWTHAEIDAGADIVVMHGAPLLHGVEIYKGKPIFYDLGNFIFNAPPAVWAIGEPIVFESVIATVEYQDQKLKSIALKPIELNYIGKGQGDFASRYAVNEFVQTRGLPSRATGEKAKYILERVTELSRPFGTNIEIHGDTANIKLTK
jgi:poly-gamma-glutamate capsule biosynthesis protein CapA/YwtB (metallophosphatase superfamily)